MEYLVFFILLSLAAIFDLWKREIPDMLSILLMCTCFLSEEGAILSGLLPALLLLMVGIICGGIGGGDIKVAASCGLVMGACKTFAGLYIGLCLLLLVHLVNRTYEKLIKKKEITDKEQAYPLVPFLLLGMLITTRLII